MTFHNVFVSSTTRMWSFALNCSDIDAIAQLSHYEKRGDAPFTHLYGEKIVSFRNCAWVKGLYVVLVDSVVCL